MGVHSWAEMGCYVPSGGGGSHLSLQGAQEATERGLIALTRVDYGRLGAYPADFIAVRGVANVYFPATFEAVSHAGTHTALSQAKAVDLLFPWAALKAGDFPRPVSDL